MDEKAMVPKIYGAVSITINEWERMRLIYDAALREIGTKLEILNNEFALAHQYNPIEHITSRIKSPESIAKKLRHNNRELTIENVVKYINDVAGIRIICSFTSDIYRIADLISGQNDVTVLKIKDYIENPKENGYRSYHMIVSVPIFLSNMVVDTKVEIQIRTIAMDFWASLEHKMYYKFEGNAPVNIRRELKECADLVKFLDQKMMAINEEIKRCSGEETEDTSSAEMDSVLRELYGMVSEEETVVEVKTEIIEETEGEAAGREVAGRETAGIETEGEVEIETGEEIRQTDGRAKEEAQKEEEKGIKQKRKQKPFFMPNFGIKG